MRKLIIVMFACMIVYAVSCKTKGDTYGKPSPQISVPQDTKEVMRQRGEYLVNIIGCGDCHAPKNMTDKGPAPDMDRFMSGFNSTRPIPNFDFNVIQRDHVVLFNPDLTAAAGPWGVSFAANLTPDETGIGNWTLQQFKRAMKEGKSKGIVGARDLLPPMPTFNLKNLRDDDIEAIFTYLKSLKPVKNIVPNPLPPTAAK